MSEMEQMYAEIAEQQQANQEKALLDAMRQVHKVAKVCASFPGVNVEIKGTWVYVSGNTKPYKDVLGRNMQDGVQKGMGLSWKNGMKKWAYAGSIDKPYYWSKTRERIEKTGDAKGIYYVYNAEKDVIERKGEEKK